MGTDTQGIAGWMPDPLGRHERRYYDGERWTEHVSDQGATSLDPYAQHAEPPTGNRGPRWRLIAGAVAAVLLVLWFVGSLDRPLSEIGLNRNPCAENLFGKKMCGDELVTFCEEHYNENANGDACRQVLEDAGRDVEAIREGQEQRQADFDACMEQAISEGDGTLADCEMP